MSAAYNLALHTPIAPTLPRRTTVPAAGKSLLYKSPRKLGFSTGCRAAASSSSSITDFNLYDLLGVDSSSTQSQIKLAYRSLQKRCHPDIAGISGHDMSIILNEAYALLSDPTSRSAYDKEQAKLSDLRGYTGRPLYSVWLGSNKEERAVFVDEVKCVGCLKCALFAGKTFAIESVYGRARVVAQWADPEHKIQEAVDSCPVDCIFMVERSDLAALEFIMSKQPRGNVRVGAGNAAGSGVSNIFVEVNKFQTKVKEAADRKSTASQNYEAADMEREAKMSAINTIRSISNWLYWQSSPVMSTNCEDLARASQKRRPEADPKIKKLREAAAARRKVVQPLQITAPTDEYWGVPVPPISNNSGPPPQQTSSVPKPEAEPRNTEGTNDHYYRERHVEVGPGRPIRSAIPMIMGAIAVAVVKLNSMSIESTTRVEDHIGGSLALQIVNSSWLQIALAGATWYVIGLAVVELISIIGTPERK